jgi:hypothetical protein
MGKLPPALAAYNAARKGKTKPAAKKGRPAAKTTAKRKARKKS